MRRIASSLALILCSATVAGVAHADAETEAKDLFERGKEMRKRGDCGGAVPLFKKAHQIYPKGLGSLRNLGECEEQLGHYASARRAWLEMKRALAVSSSDPKYQGWESDAEAAAARLHPKVAQITVDVIVKSAQYEGPANERSGVELLVNGEPLPSNLIGTTLERDPGTYVFRAQAHDAKPVEQSVSMIAGDNKRLSLYLVRTPVQEQETTQRRVAPAAPSRVPRTIGWVAVGVGGTALVGSLVTWLVRQAALDDLETKCGEADPEVGPCPESAGSAIDRGKAMSVLSPALLVVGLVGVGGGVALLATAPSKTTGASRFVLTGGIARMDATWRF